MAPNEQQKQAAWDALTEVERTALKVSFWRSRAAKEVKNPQTGEPLFQDPLGSVISDNTVPGSVAHQMEQDPTRWLRLTWVAARTAEVDRQVQTSAFAVASNAIPAAATSGGIDASLQVVILAAGLDTRAWRLKWPSGIVPTVNVWEVDTRPILELKKRALDGAPVPGKVTRHEVAADLTDPQALSAQLQSSGFHSSLPTLWVMEGIIGYLDHDAGDALMQALANLSAPSSRLVMTAPPSEREKQENESAGHVLHHAVFEEPEATLQRAIAAGWQGGVVSAKEVAERYGVERTQAVLLLQKAGH